MASAEEYAAWIVKNADKKGTPQFDTVAKAYSLAKTSIAQPKEGMATAAARRQEVNPDMSGALIGAGENVASLATGAAGQVLGGLAGIGQGVKNLFVEGGMPAGERVEQVQGAMTYQPRTDTGKDIAQGLDSVLGILPRFAERTGEKAAELTNPAVGAAVNTAIQAAPSILGKLAKAPVSKALAKSTAEAAKQTALAAPKAEALTAAKKAGYVIPPAEANPSLPNRVIEGFAGQPKVQQLASTKNQAVTNDLTRKALGVPDDVPLSIEALQDVRKQAGLAYEDVRNAGRVKTDGAFQSDLSNIVSKYVGAEKDFPRMAKADIKDAVDSAKVKEFDAGSGIDAIKIQRELADKAFRGGDTGLGKAHKAIADALESQIDRHLKESRLALGDTHAIEQFQAARKLIAQTYDVQKALKGNDIDARVLGKQYEKGRLTGDLATVGQFGSMFKGAAQTGGKNAYVPGLWETMGMGGMGGLAGLGIGGVGTAPVAAAVAAGASRPLARGLITSRAYQNAAVNSPTYAPSRTLQGANALLKNPQILNALAIAASQQDGN